MSAQTPPRPLDRLVILVVDDHRDTIDMLREYLYSAGATVIGADGARAALSATTCRSIPRAVSPATS